MHCALYVFYEANKDDYYCAAMSSYEGKRTHVHVIAIGLHKKHYILRNDNE